jgi:glycosyltransferase involved in cell wall biosynthesis
MSLKEKDSLLARSPIRSVRILFIHNTIATYRAPFFKLLDQEFDNIRFIFTYLEASHIIYGQDHLKILEELKLKDARICKAYFANTIPPLPEGIPVGLARDLLLDDFDVIVEDLQSFKVILSVLASALRKKPLISWTRQWYDFSQSFVGKLQSFILAVAVKKSAALLVPGVKPREFVCKFQIDPHKVFIMPNVSVIDSPRVSPQETLKLKEYYGVKDKKIILYVGRLVERKGVEYLIKAFSLLRRERDDVVLFMVGHGPRKSHLQELARNLSVSESIFFLGPFDREELAGFYCGCTVCVIPSITLATKEPWALVLNEAMQFGKPVIATEAVGAAYDLIKDGRNGFLIPERDEITLYKKLKILIDDEQLGVQMGVESKKIIESQYQYSDMVRGFSSALEYVYNHEFEHEN